VAQDCQSYAETVQVQSSVHHLTGKLGERPRGILVARATDHIVSRKIVAEAITDERANQAAATVAGFARLQVASNRIARWNVLRVCGRDLLRIPRDRLIPNSRGGVF
jgi:hypothetical protein